MAACIQAQAAGSSGTIAYTYFMNNDASIYHRGVLTVSSSSFFKNFWSLRGYSWSSDPAGTSVPNTYICGTSEHKFQNILTSAAWTLLSLSPFDGCGVCNGNNGVKDNAGVCFGSDFSNHTRQTWYVSPTGTGDGSSPSSPLGSLSAVLPLVNYKDTVIMLPGLYTGFGNINLNFLGKAFTLRSLNSQPDEVVIDCGAIPWGAFILNNTESYDLQITGLTLRRCLRPAITML